MSQTETVVCFADYGMLITCSLENKETLHQNIFVHRTVKLPDGTEVSGFTESTVGLSDFNEIIPQDLGFVDRV